jgi:hypothetical protein
MCTLSVITRGDGYNLAMNRDERIARPVSGAPQSIQIGNVRVLYPRDHAGGTWIGANNAGVALALLNWNDVTSPGTPPKSARSRGLVIPALLVSRSVEELRGSIGHLNVRDLLPFRLVSVFSRERSILEWRWNSQSVTEKAWPWEPRHWYSSSASDAEAERFRGEACCKAWAEADAGTVLWLRRLHTSHTAVTDAFRICVHRAEVKTVSYTELNCTPASVECRYFAGSPCEMTEPTPAGEIERTPQLENP